MSQSGLSAYRQALDEVDHSLAQLVATLGSDAVPPWAERDADVRELVRLRERLSSRFTLAVVGEFSSGKSFLLNALLGKIAFEDVAGRRRIAGLLATDINPSTATITELRYGAEELATAYFPDGRNERVPLDGLSRFVAGSEEEAPELVVVEVDSPYLQGGWIVADTPGLASINPSHRRATLNYLPRADAVLYLIDTQQPFTEGDAAFLGIVRSYIESVFIVQTKIDLWRMNDGEREAWQSAEQRIASLAAVHAPGTGVHPLSAREYAEGILTGDEALVERSRFRALLAALDARLIASSGLSRLARTRRQTHELADRALASLDLFASALQRSRATLESERESLRPKLDAFEGSVVRAATTMRERGSALRTSIDERGTLMREALIRALASALDTADIARIRDRIRLHIMVDTILANVVGSFARDVAPLAVAELRAGIDRARSDIRRFAATELPAFETVLDRHQIGVLEIAAQRFGAQPGSGAWSDDLETALRSSIVLGAIGGPGVSFVHAIASRFATSAYGTYMKRELLADLRGTFFPTLEGDVSAFVERISCALEGACDDAAAQIDLLREHMNDAALGTLDRAIVHAGVDAETIRARTLEIRTAVDGFVAEIDATVHAFAANTVSETFVTVAIPAAVQAERTFDPTTYEHGLRPERWRVAVLGALHRGKSSLINAIAGTRVLADEGAATEIVYPVHVRYGPELQAYVLGPDAQWKPVPHESAIEHALHAPVLVEVPWKLPRQLVLVHAPSFDSGEPMAEDIALTAANAASEILALFSRQLSDRELLLYGRVAEFGKPMLFAHTLADHEQPAERRQVVELAGRYLRERGIAAQRIFTVSTLDWRESRETGRAASPYNELGTLIATLEAHAEEHMQRLAQSERDQEMRERLSAVTQTEPAKRGGLAKALGRIFGGS